MIVVESGGTKSSWVFNPGKNRKCIESVGLHPQELSKDKENTIKDLIQSENLQNHSVYFYGAGCESPEAKTKITNFLEGLGLEVKQVQTDIYAACLAHLGNQAGVVGILGTGAVAAQFDGDKVIKQTSGLGYILGDEGSGFDIGKRLLQYYFNNQLPKEISDSIEKYFNHKSILHRIHEPDGRMCIAGLTKIVHENREHSSIKKVLDQAFTEFCTTALAPLNNTNPIHFIGSIAFYFNEELEEALVKQGFSMGEVKKVAVFGVFDFLSI